MGYSLSPGPGLLLPALPFLMEAAFVTELRRAQCVSGIAIADPCNWSK